MTRIPFILLSTTDGSPITGAAPTVTISKDGGAFASATNAPVEISGGYYYVDLTDAETTVTYNVVIKATATGAQPTAVVWEPEQAMPNVPTASDNAAAVWGAQTKEVTIATAQADTLATAAALATVGDNVSAVKAKTDNLPASPAAVGSAMTLTEATVTTLRNNLATISTIEAAVVSLSSGLDTLANHGDTYWSTADVSGLSTFNPSTDAVTLTDAYDAAKTASQLTTSDLSALATSAEITAASASLTTLINLLLSGLYHWQVNDTIMTVYNASDVAIGAYTLTKDATGNITAVTPIVQQETNNEG